MRTMFFYNINMYKKTHNIDVKDDELNICIYLIPDEGIGKKYYEEKYVYSSIKGYIIILLPKEITNAPTNVYSGEAIIRVWKVMQFF